MSADSFLQHYRRIVCGAGASGCALARRFIDLNDGPTCLVEAGGRSRDVRTRVPAWYPRAQRTAADWNFEIEPQASLAKRTMRWPRGKGLGGSTLINALIYMEPSDQDLHRWSRAIGRELLRPDSVTSNKVSTSPVHDLHPWCELFLQSAEQAGLRRVAPWHRSDNDVCGAHQLTAHQGHRVSAADTLFDKESSTRSESHERRLDIMTEVLVDRIEFAGHRAHGVRVLTSEGELRVVTADEIYLAAGSIGSPMILQRSGIGDTSELSALGIPIRVAVPEVGCNLQDHLVMPMVLQFPNATGLPDRFDRAARKQFREQGSGPMSSNIAEAGAMIRRSAIEAGQGSETDGDAPHLQLHVTPTHYLKYPFLKAPHDCMSITLTILHPYSRGRVRLQSADPCAPPRIDPGYLSDPRDVNEFVRAMQWFKQWPGLESIYASGGQLVLPNPKRSSDADLERALRSFAMTIYHPAGTCRMGRDSESVVTGDFQVRGVDGLFVVDASVLPDLPSGNTMAAAMMLPHWLQ